MDASAATGIVRRRGLSRIRHLDTDVLWLQHQQLRRVLQLVKVKGLDNVADMFTKHVDHPTMLRHNRLLGLNCEEESADKAPVLTHG